MKTIRVQRDERGEAVVGNIALLGFVLVLVLYAFATSSGDAAETSRAVTGDDSASPGRPGTSGLPAPQHTRVGSWVIEHLPFERDAAPVRGDR